MTKSIMRARVAGSLAGLMLVAACGDGAVGGADEGGSVRVLYAGSLINTMQDAMGPAFTESTDYRFQGFTAGSKKVARNIESKVWAGSVFISARPGVNTTLTGQKNGDWVGWYAVFARSPLVIGYRPDSEFADEFENRPWYEVLTQPGIRVGRTDPELDPKGELTVEALELAERRYGKPKLPETVKNETGVVLSEDGLVGRLQAGQLDAGFFYFIEAAELRNLDVVRLGPIDLHASYTVTVLNRAPNKAGGVRFVEFLLGPEGTKLMRGRGFRLIRPPEVRGDRSAVPRKLRDDLGMRGQ